MNQVKDHDNLVFKCPRNPINLDGLRQLEDMLNHQVQYITSQKVHVGLIVEYMLDLWVIDIVFFITQFVHVAGKGHSGDA